MNFCLSPCLGMNLDTNKCVNVEIIVFVLSVVLFSGLIRAVSAASE